VPRELQAFADHRNVTLAVSKTGWAGMNIFEEWASEFCDWLHGYRERRGLSSEASPGPPWLQLLPSRDEPDEPWSPSALHRYTPLADVLEDQRDAAAERTAELKALHRERLQRQVRGLRGGD
jgi:hypothetical protein